MEKGGALIARRLATLSDKSIKAQVAWMNGNPMIVLTVTWGPVGMSRLVWEPSIVK
jgi:hypothetical protein